MTTETPTTDARAQDAATLDDIFRVNVGRRGDALALLDPSDRAVFTDGHARAPTYREVDAAAGALAQRLQDLGLRPGAVVGLQLPNTVESIVALLACARAGLVAALLPLLWRRAEAVAALREVGARALIVCGRVGGADHAEVALHIAAETFTIRFVCAFGTDLADGVVGLDDIWTPATAAPVAPSRRSARDPAAITFEVGPEGPVPVARTHAELLVGGLAVMLEAGLPRQATMIGTMLPSSFAALSATYVAWLLTGGTLLLHQPFDALQLAAQLEEMPCDLIVLPGPLVSPLAESGVIGRASSLARIVAVWRSPERQAASPPWNAAAPFVDLLAFGELGFAALCRGADGRPRPMQAGPLVLPSRAAQGTTVMTVARTAAGTLGLGGPMVPESLRTAAERAPPARDHIDTRYPCRIDPATHTVTLTGSPPGMVSVGGYRFALRELQDMVGRLEAEGVLAALPDLLAGQKLAGRAVDATAMRYALAQLGVNPLVGEAFRDRRPTPAA